MFVPLGRLAPPWCQGAEPVPVAQAKHRQVRVNDIANPPLTPGMRAVSFDLTIRTRSYPPKPPPIGGRAHLLVLVVGLFIPLFDERDLRDRLFNHRVLGLGFSRLLSPVTVPRILDLFAHRVQYRVDVGG